MHGFWRTGGPGSTDAEYVSLPSLAWGNNATNIPAWTGGKQLGTATHKKWKGNMCSFAQSVVRIFREANHRKPT